MDRAQITEYERQLRNDPSAFVDGVMSFCKQASPYDGEENGLLSRILPWVLLLGGGYLALKGGEFWGRYAKSTGNPNGPIKGPIGKLLEKSLPEGNKVYWPGQKEYDDIVGLRRAQDDARWDREFGNSVSDGRAASLTMRDHG